MCCGSDIELKSVSFFDLRVTITPSGLNEIPSRSTFAYFGFARGTFKGIKTDKNENYWRLPVSWKVIVRDDKIKLWQVYADTKIPIDIIDKNK